MVRKEGPQLSLIDLPGVTHNADQMQNIHEAGACDLEHKETVMSAGQRAVDTPLWKMDMWPLSYFQRMIVATFMLNFAMVT